MREAFANIEKCAGDGPCISKSTGRVWESKEGGSRISRFEKESVIETEKGVLELNKDENPGSSALLGVFEVHRVW